MCLCRLAPRSLCWRPQGSRWALHSQAQSLLAASLQLGATRGTTEAPAGRQWSSREDGLRRCCQIREVMFDGLACLQYRQLYRGEVFCACTVTCRIKSQHGVQCTEKGLSGRTGAGSSEPQSPGRLHGAASHSTLSPSKACLATCKPVWACVPVPAQPPSHSSVDTGQVVLMGGIQCRAQQHS